MSSWTDVKGHAFLIGAAKCGTSSLARWLAGHPDVCVSRPKEPLFFEADFERGLDYYWTTYFPHWQGECLVVDARHRNMFLPYVPERIWSVDPEARIFAVVREPVSRAYSHWWHRYSRGRESLEFDDALAADQHRLATGDNFSDSSASERWRLSLQLHRAGLTGWSTYRTYLDSGHYAEQLSRYFDRFGRERMHVMFLEELADAPTRELSAVAVHLEIDPAGELPVANEARPSTSLRGGFLTRSLSRHPIARLVPPRWRSQVKRLLVTERARPPMAESTRRSLVDYYASHNAALEGLLRRPLPSQWNTASRLDGGGV